VPSQSHAGVRPEKPASPLDILIPIYKLADEGNLEQALTQLDDSPAWLQRTPEYLSLRASLLMQYGDMQAGGKILRELERKQPHYFPTYPSLAAWYLQQEWPGHALQTVRKALASFELDDEGKDLMETFVTAASSMIQSLASKLDLPFEAVEQATFHNENAQMELVEQNYSEVERQARKALEFAPHWTAPRNNLAYVLFVLGRRGDAIAEAEKVLASDPVNVHGLKNAAIFHLGSGQEEKARKFAGRLIELIPAMEEESSNVDVAISALAMLEDSESLWEVAQRFIRKPETALLDYSWQSLGVAAARLGHLKEAKKILERGHEEDLEKRETTLAKVNQAIKSGAKKLLWPPVFPGMEILLSERMLREWTEIAKKVEENRPTENQKRKIDAFLEKYPSILQAFKRMMWNEEISTAGANMLVMLNKPEADAEIMRFGLSDWGDNDSRMEAVMALTNAGRYASETPVHFWDAEKGAWHEVQMFSQKIGDVEYELKPRIADLIEKSRRAKNPQDGIAFLRRAVEDDPTCAVAVFNLGVLLQQQGQREEGEAMMRRSVEVDPNYIFGFANLGLMEAQRGNKDAALDHLMKVTQANAIANNTAAVSSLAHMVIAIGDNDIEMARRHFDLAVRFHPDSPILEHFREMLEQAEEFSNSFGFFRDFQKQSANRYHRKMLNITLSPQMGLEACLSLLTKDNLVGTSRFWKTSTSGKKAGMVARLAENILDAELLQEVVIRLNEKESEALTWTLDGGGSQPWEEFIGKFGDDMDESPWWNYHDPESIPGRLKCAGLLHVGKLDGQESAFIPADLRGLLADALKQESH
jgi:tetratricopeptide (TPR) repeat protein